MSSSLLLSLFIHGFLSTVFLYITALFSFGQTVSMFSKHSKVIESSPQLNLVQSCRTFVPQTILYSVSLYVILGSLLEVRLVCTGVVSMDAPHLMMQYGTVFQPPSWLKGEYSIFIGRKFSLPWFLILSNSVPVFYNVVELVCGEVRRQNPRQLATFLVMFLVALVAMDIGTVLPFYSALPGLVRDTESISVCNV